MKTSDHILGVQIVRRRLETTDLNPLNLYVHSDCMLEKSLLTTVGSMHEKEYG